MADHPAIDELTRQFKALWGQLRPDSTQCPFVVDQASAKQVELMHCSAGRDAMYVQVSRKWDESPPLNALAVTIRYAPSIEGTTIIYDLLDRTMQGKARPFVCDLTHYFTRMYVLLPCQIERTSLVLRDGGENRAVEVAFLDAQREIIQAALPFELSVLDSSGKNLTSHFSTTNRNGKCQQKLPPMSRSLVVRSALTGREESLEL